MRLAEVARLRARLPGLSEKEWRAIEAAMQAVTNKIAHPATQAIKASAQEDADPAALDAIRRAFGLEDNAGERTQAPAHRAPSEAGAGWNLSRDPRNRGEGPETNGWRHPA